MWIVSAFVTLAFLIRREPSCEPSAISLVDVIWVGNSDEEQKSLVMLYLTASC